MVHLCSGGSDSGSSSSHWTTTRKTNKIAANSLKYQHHDDDDDSSLLQIASLAKKGKFDLLLQALTDLPNVRFLESSNNNNIKQQLSDENSCILHIVLSHCPPLHIVELILRRMKECCDETTALLNNAFPVPEEIKNAMGQTPLHLAVAAGCDVSVIDRLLSGVSLLVPALTKDHLDRYPLHYACCMPHSSSSSCTIRKRKTGGYRAERDNRRETIYLLLNTYPVAVVISDVHGKTPLDYALENKLDARILDALITVAKHHKHYQVGNRRPSQVVTKQVAAAKAATKPCKQHLPLLKRKLLLGVGGCSKSSSSPAATAAVAAAPHASEITTERDSTDANEEDDQVFLPDGLLCLRNNSNSNTGNSSTLSRRRRSNMLRLDDYSNLMLMDDLSTLGWDVLSTGAMVAGSGSSSATKRLLSSSTSTAVAAAAAASGPIVARVKTLTVSPPLVPASNSSSSSSATTSVIIRCKCKSLLRGRMKKKMHSGTRGGSGSGSSNNKASGGRAKTSIKNQKPSQRDVSLAVAAETAATRAVEQPVEPSPSAAAVNPKQEEEEYYTVRFGRFIAV